MTIPSSRSLILWISVFSITSPSADFGRLRKTSDIFGRLRTSSGMFGNDRVVFKNPSTPRIKISRLYLRQSWLVYSCHNKNALTVASGPACLEIRSRNEEAINSTRNMIYSLKVFYFLLYRRRYFFLCF